MLTDATTVHRPALDEAIERARSNGLVHRVEWSDEPGVLLEQLYVARSVAELGFGIEPRGGSTTPYEAAHLPRRPGFGTRRLPLTWGRAGGVVEIRDTRSGDLRVHTLSGRFEVRDAEAILSGAVLARWSSPTADALVEVGAALAAGDGIVGLPVRRFRRIWHPTVLSLLGAADEQRSTTRPEPVPVRLTVAPPSSR
jgi:hypothetical protein